MNSLNLALLLPAAAGVVVSFLTELVTKSNASQGVKSFVFLVLASIGSAFTTVIYDQSADWTVYAAGILIAVLTGLATHYTGATRVVQDASPTIGLGPAAPEQPTTGQVIDLDPEPSGPPSAPGSGPVL